MEWRTSVEEEVSILLGSTLLTRAANNSDLSATAATIANTNMNTNTNTLIQVRSKPLRYVTLRYVRQTYEFDYI